MLTLCVNLTIHACNIKLAFFNVIIIFFSYILMKINVCSPDNVGNHFYEALNIVETAADYNNKK